MSADLTIHAAASPPRLAERSPGSPPGVAVASPPPQQQQGSTEGPPAAAPRPSPSAYLDPAAGLVVLEFTNQRGDVVSTIPTSRQLAALHRDRMSNDGMPQGGARRAGASSPAATPRPAGDARAGAPPGAGASARASPGTAPGGGGDARVNSPAAAPRLARDA